MGIRGFCLQVFPFTSSKIRSSKEAHGTAGDGELIVLADIYVIVFGLSYGPLIWTLPSELFDNASHAKGVGFAVALSWFPNFIIVQSTPEYIPS